MALTPGTRLGSYDILGPLGAGGMGEVYRAHDPTLGRDVAIKILPDALLADPDRLARFDREARILAALNHPHIGAIYSVVRRAETACGDERPGVTPPRNRTRAPSCRLADSIDTGQSPL